jgi:hypothetical protein
MVDQDNSKVYFYDTLKCIVDSEPYAVLPIQEVESLPDRLKARAKKVCLEASTTLKRAIENARHDGYFPFVIFPARKFEEAMILLNNETD